jgi:hypothetical protein
MALVGAPGCSYFSFALPKMSENPHHPSNGECMKAILSFVTTVLILGGIASAALTSWLPPVGTDLCYSNAAGFTIKQIQYNPSATGVGTILLTLNEYPSTTFKYSYKGLSATETIQANAALSMLLTSRTTGNKIDIYLPNLSVCSGAVLPNTTYDFSIPYLIP